MQNEIIVNGVKYIKENLDISNYVICRTYSAGVHAGYLKENKGNGEVVLTKSRRLWYWDGAASLSQLAMDGVSKPQNCKFPCEVDSIILFGVIEIIHCSDDAKKSIQGVKIWSE